MEKRIQVTITVQDRKVTLEGPEEFVREEVQRLTAFPSASTSQPGHDSASPAQSAFQSERTLIAQKLPEGHSERVAVLAFALKEGGLSEFTKDDMCRAYRRCNIRTPKVMSQAIRDAKNKFDYIEGGGAKGSYRLSAHGERTVLFDLPRKTGRK